MKLHETLRAGHVSRWNIVATMRQQSIAEHMWNTTMIASEITLRLGMEDPAPAGFIGYCLKHDRHEVVTGDVPTPTKRKFGDQWEIAERGVDPEYDKFKVHYQDTIWEHVLKCADIMDGLWFLRVWGVKSSGHVNNITIELIGKLDAAISKGQMRWPEYNWIMVHRVEEEMY